MVVVVVVVVVVVLVFVVWHIENLFCVDSQRLRVYIQNVPVYAGTTSTCIKHVRVVPVHTEACRMYTRGGGERRPRFAHSELSRAPEVRQKKRKNLTHFFV